MGWIIRVAGGDDVLDFLSQIDGAPWTIAQREERYELQWPDLNEVADYHEVHGRVIELLQTLSGLAQLRFGSDARIAIANLSREDPNGPASQFLFIEPIKLELGSGAPSLDPAFVRRAVELSRRSDAVADALRIVSSGARDWVNLYRVFEVVQADASKAAIERWFGTARVTLFTRSANHPSVGGDNARHSRTSVEPPRVPMGSREARLFIEELVYTWLQSCLEAEA